jgi:hypothetical protein
MHSVCQHLRRRCVRSCEYALDANSGGKLAGKQNWRYIARELPPKRDAVERICDFDEIYDLFDEATIRAQASRCINCPDPPCVKNGCPLANRIPEWLALTADGRFIEAAALSRSTSNMPEICSRVCPQDRLCESACILNARSEPVSIGAVEKFINEYAFVHESLDALPFLIQKNIVRGPDLVVRAMRDSRTTRSLKWIRRGQDLLRCRKSLQPEVWIWSRSIMN